MVRPAGAPSKPVGTASSGTWTQAGSESDDVAHLARHDLNLLVPLAVLLDEAGVTRSAQRVRLSQPAMSHILNRCRSLLKDDLLVRVRGRMELTARGRALRQPLALLLETVRSIVEPRLPFDPATCSRTVSISMSNATATAIMPPLLRRLAAAAPLVKVQLLRSLRPSEDLVDHPEIHLAILPDILHTDHPRIRLYQDPWRVVMDAQVHAAQHTFTVADLTRLEHVAYWSDNMIKPHQRMEAEGLSWRTRLTAHDFVLLALLLRGTDMVAILPGRLARVLGELGAWKSFALPLDVAPLRMDLVWNPHLKADPLCDWLTGVLQEEFATVPTDA